ncbi:hypothetical protein B4102_4038 [Heyndrickxia sporothermodurans]|uniref:TM2 domain-containing protein n=1 Tax=Heyndrickxia sporothermodurans TaxID=46224 RepID=A0A150KKL4_9BACI|nr:hypothetical protein [Heyndrickxia sporothermodurans]KYC88506.1 hypothetical protein B4102_4038 [Heyndrickxia sporothermodurans]
MKKGWLSGILSFLFPGLGHLYLGLIVKGIIIMAVYVLCLLVLPPVGTFIAMVVIWLFAIIDSTRKAKLINASINV